MTEIELIQKYYRLIEWAVHKWTRRNEKHWREDLLQVGTIGLLRAIRTCKEGYDLKPYAARIIVQVVSAAIRKYRKQGFNHVVKPEVFRFSEVDWTTSEGSESFANQQVDYRKPERFLDCEDLLAARCLREREVELLRLRFEDEMTCEEIAANKGCSKQAINNVQVRGLRKLRKLLEN